MNVDPQVFIIIIILLIATYYFESRKNQENDKKEQYGFKDFNDFSQPQEMEYKQTRYNSDPLWNEINNTILTIVGGDSDREFGVGRKFRIRSRDRELNGNHPNGDRSNMPYYYTETSADGKAWTLHPEYSVPGDAISFEGYNVVNFYSPGGNLQFVRYPNGRIWVGNEEGHGNLRTIELTNVKIPFLSEKDPEEGANMTTSALGGHIKKSD